MKPNPYEDYQRPRDPVEFAAGYIILLIVALIAFAPIYVNDRASERVTVAAKSGPVDAKRTEATSTATSEAPPSTESF